MQLGVFFFGNVDMPDAGWGRLGRAGPAGPAFVPG
jgi:hypothetical protein